MRYLTSSTFVFGIVAFFLPWLDIRCTGDKEPGIVQSGYQIAAGTASPGSGETHPESNKDADNPTPEELKAPSLYVYALFLVAGAAICLFVASRKWWRSATIVCVVCATAILGVNTARGFPFQREVAKDRRITFSTSPSQSPSEQRVWEIRYRYGFYLAWVLTPLPLLGVLVDLCLPKQTSRHPFELVDPPGNVAGGQIKDGLT